MLEGAELLDEDRERREGLRGDVDEEAECPSQDRESKSVRGDSSEIWLMFARVEPEGWVSTNERRDERVRGEADTRGGPVCVCVIGAAVLAGYELDSIKPDRSDLVVSPLAGELCILIRSARDGAFDVSELLAPKGLKSKSDNDFWEPLASVEEWVVWCLLVTEIRGFG